MSYIPGMNQNWGGATPANAGATSTTPTSTPINPLTGMPYTGPMSETSGNGSYSGYGEVGPEFSSNAGANSWLNARGMPSEPGQYSSSGGGSYGNGGSNSNSGGLSVSKGGAIPAFDGGGDVPDPNQSSADGQNDPTAGTGSDPNVNTGGGTYGSGSGVLPSQPASDEPPANPNQGGANINDMLNSVMDTYDYGLNKYGMGGSSQQQAYMPSRPAGPGGDQPNTNPFPTKTPSPAFGQKFSEDGTQQQAYLPTRPAGPGGDQPNTNPFPTQRPNPAFGQRVAAADMRPIPPGPNGGPVKGALPPAPMDPRDFLPGGRKASQMAIPTQSAARGGTIHATKQTPAGVPDPEFNARVAQMGQRQISYGYDNGSGDPDQLDGPSGGRPAF